MKQTENKMKKYLDQILTAAFVSMLVAVLFIVVMPGERGKAAAATGSAISYDGPFDLVKGYSFSEKVAPGKKTHIKTLVTNFTPSQAEGIESEFHSFGVESSDERVEVSGVTISNVTSNIPFYPISNAETYKLEYQYVYAIEFDVTCSDNLDPNSYDLSLYGITVYTQYNTIYYKSNSQPGDVNRPIKTILAEYTLTSTDAAKKASVVIENITYDKSKMASGNSNSFSVKLTNNGKIDASEIYIDATLGTSLLPNYEMKKLRVGSLKAGATTTFKVPFTVKAGAENGLETVSFEISGLDKYGKGIEEVKETIYVNIGKGTVETVTNAPSLSLSTKQNYKFLVPSTDDSVVIRITNNGTRVAKNIRLSCEKGFGVGEGLTKSYTASYIAVDDIPAGKTVKVEVPFLVGATFTKGIHELEFSATYLDEDKHEYKSDVMTMYVEHYKTGEIAEVDGLTYLLISGVTQTPNMPQAGERVTVSFNVKNKGTEKVTNLHFYATGLSAAGFQPVSGEPYQDEGSLEAGESKKVTMTFMAGEDIPKGVNSLTIGYDYFDASNKAQQSTTTIYVLNVINHKFDEIDVGRPKIIVSDYVTEPEILRAGETFDFSYTLKNTHTGKEARNIKITLSQADGVLAPAQGTNIFYIDKLDPTQEVVLSLPLKSRADTVTGDYAVVLKLEYEYDDMSEVDKEHGGVSEENTLKLRVIEN